MTFLIEPLTEDNFNPQIDPLLWEAAAEASFGVDQADWMWEQMAQGKFLVWKWQDGPNAGMVVVEFRTGQGERILHVVSVAGKGFLAHLPEIFEELKKFGREYNCSKMTGNAMRPGLQRAYLKMGGNEEYRQYGISLLQS